jgi:predicted metal-binding membrane protein
VAAAPLSVLAAPGLKLVRMAESAHDLRHLTPAAQRLGGLFARPKPLAIGCLALLAALGWVYLGLMLAGMERPQALGPGMSALDIIADRLGLGDWGRATLAALCRPTFGDAGASVAGGLAGSVAGVLTIALMWGAMILAMMLPTAGPMILTYAEIADTAARKGERAVSPVVLIAGYAVVWFGFAAVLAVLQVALTRAALLDPAMASTSVLFSGAVFLAAGAYQFSALKHACVTRCQQPFPFFFANWSDRPRDVVRLGVRQGFYCVGCCWAMMLVMFAVGVMNVIWMAGLGFIMAAEKIATTARFSRAIGAVFGAIGIAFIAAAVIAHWPVRPG